MSARQLAHLVVIVTVGSSSSGAASAAHVTSFAEDESAVAVRVGVRSSILGYDSRDVFPPSALPVSTRALESFTTCNSS